MSQIAIVSLMAACFWSRSPPSNMLTQSEAKPRISRSWSNCLTRCSGVWYDRNFSACRFQSSTVPLAQYLMMQRLSLYFSWANQPSFPRNDVSSLGMASCERGGKIYCSVLICIVFSPIHGELLFALLLHGI